MKITFTFWQLIGILIFILICYYTIPWFYNSWIFPEDRESGTITQDTFIARSFSVIFSVGILIIYLGPMDGGRHLYKKRSITLKNPFKN
mgnify:FL=1